MRRSTLFLSAALVTVLGYGTMRVVGDVRARFKNAAYTRASRTETERERARLAGLRFPPAEGDPREEMCDLAGVRFGSSHAPAWADVRVASKNHATEPLSPSVEATVKEARPDIERLSTALRCDRIDPTPALAMASAADTSHLAAALVVDGHLLVQGGDVGKGAQRYLEAVRLGANMGQSDPTFGWGACAMGALALADMMASHDDVPIERIVAFMAALEPVLPSGAAFMRHFRLKFGEAAQTAHLERSVSLSAPMYGYLDAKRRRGMRANNLFVPQSVRYLRATEELDPLFRRVESLRPEGKRSAVVALENEVEKKHQTTWNQFVLDLVGGAKPALEPTTPWMRGRAAFRLAEAVAHIEKIRKDSGQVPRALLDEPWMRDPASDGGTFRYEPGDNGYRVWSVGRNGKDERGGGDDILVERR